MTDNWGFVAVDGDTHKIEGDPYWVGDDFYVPVAGRTLVLRNAYVSGLKFGGSDCVDESVTLVGNNKYWGGQRADRDRTDEEHPPG